MASLCLQDQGEQTPALSEEQVIESCNRFASDTVSTAAQVRNFCAGRGISGETWYEYWNNNNCSEIFNCSLFTLSDGNVGANREQLPLLQRDFLNVFNTYLSPGNVKISDSNSPDYNPFQEEIRKACLASPGACDNYLKKGCQACTRNEIASNSALLKFCGCFAPPLNPSFGISEANGNVQCDPLCTRLETIQRENPIDFTQLRCKEDICVIDDISITATKTNAGGINFKQVCSQCQAGNCRCIISDISVTLSQVNFQGQSFSESCGDTSLCLQKNEAGVETPVNCAEAVASIQRPGNTNNILNVPHYIIYAIILVLFFIIIVVIGIYLNK